VGHAESVAAAALRPTAGLRAQKTGRPDRTLAAGRPGKR
jgi:hypothetical protein